MIKESHNNRLQMRHQNAVQMIKKQPIQAPNSPSDIDDHKLVVIRFT
jgi:hypothetical protein